MTGTNGTSTLTAKDFATTQDVRWCPGCGDYSILKQVQTILADSGAKREDTVFISGIGCSSRFPYYINTFGMHGIHGRATAIASGVKASNPDLNVWVITGDGDGLSIGGNHLIHLLRRNFDLNILLFNNEIYGLTKGQYSPTSPVGSISKSTPHGSVDHPFNPVALSLGSDATFIARTLDRDVSHMREVLTKANQHKGASLVEIYQNCLVFNDGAFSKFTDKTQKLDNALYLKDGEPLLFCDETKGIKLDGFNPVVVSMEDHTADDLWIHDEHDRIKAAILSQFFSYSLQAFEKSDIPRPFGVFFSNDRETYEDMLTKQIEETLKQKGEGDLDELLAGKCWEIK